MRMWRQAHPLTPEQKIKAYCRSYAGIYKRRGLLIKEPCQTCKSPNVEMHHDDYSKPLTVKWLCRSCHLMLHKAENGADRHDHGMVAV